MRRTLAAGGLLTCLLAAVPSWAAEGEDGDKRASPLVSWKRSLCIYTGCFLEPLIPDVRYEWGADSKERWLLSWPVHPWASPPLDIPGPTLFVSPFIEPQLRLKPSVLRLLAGARVYVFPDTLRLGVLAEGAGLWGQDGSGGVGGVGLTFDLIERHPNTVPWTVSLVLRRAWTGEGNRTDVSFDVTVPLNMFLGSPMDSGESASRSSSNRDGNPRLRTGPSSSLFPRGSPHTM
ncbi:hypothetical protein JY651_15020 [Pyxidicoccus parkwayensis]|uniref:Lipoprotein n=1 Tax=Pyxidicoccus parkwayensis TaxID=2813578 RepID=A0ABX7P6S8_9BACT|nr:hypothetical protein [Pyxidicoccus parkwaysis]QSQ26158.1 hypothetical protein JY651_15020 [Pyxidicoccus parkwaysis]